MSKDARVYLAHILERIDRIIRLARKPRFPARVTATSTIAIHAATSSP